MSWLQLPDFHIFLIFTLVLTRVSGLVISVPIYGTPETPMQVRALLAVALAVLVAPTQLDVVVNDPGSLTNYLIVLASELFIGLILGLGVTILFSGVQMTGQLVAQASGMAMANVVDPSSGEEIPELARLLFWVTIAVYVILGGHRIVMAGLLNTFAAMPLGSGLAPPSLEAIVQTLQILVGQSFSLGVRAAGPLLTSLLLATLVVALIGRTLPQLNVMVLGFGLNSVLTFGVLALSIGAAVWVFQDELVATVDLLMEAFQTPVSTVVLPVAAPSGLIIPYR